MTQKFSEQVGALQFNSSTFIPEAVTYGVDGVINTLQDRVRTFQFDAITNTSGDAIISFEAPDNGYIEAVTLVNGSVACDGSNGLELEFLNKTAADAVVAYIGFGSGTEAVKATDEDSAVAAYASSTVKSTTKVKVNKADTILCTIDRDGTTVVGTLIVDFRVGSLGR